MKIYVETPVRVEKGDFFVVDDVQEKGCHCGTRKYVVQLTTAGSLDHDDGVKEEEIIQQTSCYL
jgi:hypothetical protein